jgi:hypothetical protein
MKHGFNLSGCRPCFRNVPAALLYERFREGRSASE